MTWPIADAECKKGNGYTLAVAHSEEEKEYMDKLFGMDHWLGGLWRKGEGFKG